MRKIWSFRMVLVLLALVKPGWANNALVFSKPLGANYSPLYMVDSSSDIFAVIGKNRGGKKALFFKKPDEDFRLVTGESDPRLENTTFVRNGSFYQVSFSGHDCFFLTNATGLVGASDTIAWQVRLNDPELRPEKIIQRGQTTNLGIVNKVITVFPSSDGVELFLGLELEGSVGRGIFRLVSQTLVETGLRGYVPPYQLASLGKSLIYFVHVPPSGRLDETNWQTRQTSTLLKPGDDMAGDIINLCCDATSSEKGAAVIYSTYGIENNQNFSFGFLYPDGSRKKILTYGRNVVGIGVFNELAPTHRETVGKSVIFKGLVAGSPTIISWDPSTSMIRPLLLDTDRLGNRPIVLFARSNVVETKKEVFFIGNEYGGYELKVLKGIRPMIKSSSVNGNHVTLSGYNFAGPDVTRTELKLDGATTSPVSLSEESLTFEVTTGPSDVNAAIIIYDSSGNFAEDKVLLTNVGVPPPPVPIPVPRPIFSGEGLVNAANFKPRLAPCAIASLFGTNLSRQGTAVASSLPLPRILAGSQVLLNDRESPLFFVSPGQINFQIACEVVAGPVIIKGVSRNPAGEVLVSEPVGVTLVAEAAGVFRSGSQPLVFNEGGLVTIENRGRAGGYVVIYATGLGAVNPPVASGEGAPADPLARTTDESVVKVGGIRAEVLYSGLVPGLVGLYQINVRLPENVSGQQVEIEINNGEKFNIPIN